MPASTDNGLWGRRYNDRPAPSAALVCFPHAGGTAPFFRPVSFGLTTAVDVIAMQYPGRQDRRDEAPLDDVRRLADGAYQALRDDTDLPLTLFGHSMGAVVAFEVARRFEADGRQLEALFVSGRTGPATDHGDDVHRHGDEAIIAEIARLDGSASIVLQDPDLMRAALPSLRADYRAVETYRCQPTDTVACPIVALTGDDDPKTSIEDAQTWQHHTTGDFALHVFRGGHFYLSAEMPAVLELLDRHLAGSVAA